MKYLQGYLFYDRATQRMDFEYAPETFYGGLHCGECFEAYINQNPTPWGPERYEWEEVSIEYDHKNDRWYLPSHPLQELSGLLIRMRA